MSLALPQALEIDLRTVYQTPDLLEHRPNDGKWYQPLFRTKLVDNLQFLLHTDGLQWLKFKLDLEAFASHFFFFLKSETGAPRWLSRLSV